MIPAFSIVRRLRFAVALFALTVLVGTIVYSILLKLDPLTALYFTIVTLTTVGYGDVLPSTPAARAFTMVFILGGLAIGYYTLGVLLSGIVQGEIGGAIQTSRAQRAIRRMNNHAIICGLGRIGSDLAENLAAESAPFIVIEQDDAAIKAGREAGYTMLKGDATSDETLRQAGIDRAGSIAPALASDADNLYVVISARQLNPSIRIVARATDGAAAEKMTRAGADRAIRPLHIGARQMAQAILRPAVLEFIQLSGRTPQQEYALEEINVRAGSPLVGPKLTFLAPLKELGVIIIGIKRAAGETVFNPSGETDLRPGDTLVVVGRIEALARLAVLAAQAN